MPNKLIYEILEYIDININIKIEINTLVNKFYYNRFYIMKLFKKEIGLTIIDYINYIRIYNSIKEINTSNNNLLNIALNNGFYSLEYFSETFKKIISLSPKEYRDILKHKSILSDEEYYQATNNIINIKTIIDKSTNYKRKYIMYNNHEHKLTIFK